MIGEDLKPEKALIARSNLLENILYSSQIIGFENYTGSIQYS